jgi:NAD(P)-dependent dehydrogenase (short-subunit alcohol dehydrogenase family)
MNAGGAVVNISSIASERPGSATAYGVSKSALEGFTRAIAMQLAPQEVRANCVRPGPVWTALAARLAPEDRHDALRKDRVSMTLLGTEGTAWDVAEAVAFFASDASRWITGQILTVDAGGLLRYDRPY